MANPKKKLATNVEGSFFVDDSCINCDACRIIAPSNFEEMGEFSSVHKQPKDEKEEKESFEALISCPTGSIGYEGSKSVKDYLGNFPREIAEGVYFNGYTSKKSFGARTFFIRHPEGNWLTDSPKYVPALVKAFHEMGGIKYIFLTHRDDVADADKYAKEFGAKRIIHKLELDSQPDSEIVLNDMDDEKNAQELSKAGLSESELADFKIITTPGHSHGHLVLLYKDKYLFSGDHLWWSRRTKAINASDEFCWYSWEEQIKSLRKLLAYDFEWLLPGHGRLYHKPSEQMRLELKDFIDAL